MQRSFCHTEHLIECSSGKDRVNRIYLKHTMKLPNLLVSTLAVAALSLGQIALGAISTVNEDNGATTNGFGNQSVWHQVAVEHPAIITTGGGAPGAGWDFSSSLASLTASGITHIDLTMTLQDGDSGSSDFDFNHLFFYVGGSRDANTGVYTGGINTGIVLNGFRAASTDTVTFSLDISPTIGAQILTQLNGNAGRLSGFIVSDNTADTAPNGNQMFAGNSNLPSDATTTLTLVPEPATLALLGAGTLLLLSPQVRRFRRNI
jgi:hypothetical protein